MPRTLFDTAQTIERGRAFTNVAGPLAKRCHRKKRKADRDDRPLYFIKNRWCGGGDLNPYEIAPISESPLPKGIDYSFNAPGAYDGRRGRWQLPAPAFTSLSWSPLNGAPWPNPDSLDILLVSTKEAALHIWKRCNTFLFFSLKFLWP